MQGSAQEERGSKRVSTCPPTATNGRVLFRQLSPPFQLERAAAPVSIAGVTAMLLSARTRPDVAPRPSFPPSLLRRRCPSPRAPAPSQWIRGVTYVGFKAGRAGSASVVEMRLVFQPNAENCCEKSRVHAFTAHVKTCTPLSSGSRSLLPPSLRAPSSRK